MSPIRNSRSNPTTSVSNAGIFFASGLTILHCSAGAIFFGDGVRVAVLYVGFAVMLASSLYMIFKNLDRLYEASVILVLVLGAELLFYLNHHLIYEGKQIAFRAVCYLMTCIGWTITWIPPQKRMGIFTKPNIFVFVTGCISFVLGLINILYILGNRSDKAGRIASSEDGSPVGLAYASGVAAIIAITVGLSSSSRKSRILWFSAALAWSGSIMFTASRGAIVAICISFILSLFTLSKDIKKLIISFAWALGTLVPISLFLSTIPFIYEQFDFISRRFMSLEDLSEDKSVGGGRFRLWEYYLDQKGVLFLGMDGYDASKYPHNLTLELICRLGAWIGVIFFLSLVYFFVRAFFKKSQLRGLDAVLYFAALFAMINAQFNLTAEFLRPLWLFFGFALGESWRRWANSKVVSRNRAMKGI